MWGVNKKAILVETGEYYSEDDTPSVYTTVIDSLSELMTKLGNDISGDRSAKVMILQNVEKSSLREINSTAYRHMLNAKKRIEAASKARTAKAKKSQATQKQKELEKARALLKEAGEL